MTVDSPHRFTCMPELAMPSVSVIIPAYNASATIAEALDSVRAQTLPPDEVIVVDDASTDDTVMVVKQYEADQNRRHGWTVSGMPQAVAPLKITLLRMDVNRGPAASRNRGVAEAKGVWIAFLDADDSWVRWRLAVQMQMSRLHPGVVMWCGAVVDGDPRAALHLPERKAATPQFLTLTDIALSNPVATSTVYLRHTTFVDAGGFDECFRGPEDYDLWMRIAAMGQIGRAQETLAIHREISGSVGMDDRRFLPEGLRVLRKAFGPGGVLANRQCLRSSAEATQYRNASWMAFRRGARATACGLWAKSYARDWRSPWRLNRPRWRLLFRYIVGW